ncbi:hypothetical protein BGX38DRAFT_1314412 [Terfezia claveryi]|nr:hypothetical protein BGX38DRAFT_1314412 [Terfezia claveryi]
MAAEFFSRLKELEARPRKVVYLKAAPEEDSDDELFGRDSESEEDESTSSPWVANGNALGYLDSDDEREIDGWGEEEMQKRRDRLSKDEWRDVGEFLLTILAYFLNEGGPSGQDGILREILGEDDDEDAAENGEDGKTAVFMRLHTLQEQLEGVSSEAEEVEMERDDLRNEVIELRKEA